MSFASATKALLSGKTLTWAKFGDAKAGTITLNEPGQRRLLAYLLKLDSTKVADGDESLFKGLIAAWTAKDDPATNESATVDDEGGKSVWRLHRVEACNFGGLTIFGGVPFDFWPLADNWCLLGQNGSGKTSLASAVLWALTGKRIREQDGPIDETGAREPVTTGDGKKIGDWPPFASYPVSPADLIQPVEVWVRLTFQDAAGGEATAYRHLSCPVTGASTPKVEIDPRILQAAQLMETGILMPARLARIGLGKQSQSLYEAVKVLTGLDQLADIADGCGAFGNGARRFLKYGKENGLETQATKFDENIAKAKAKAAELEFTLPEVLDIDSKTVVANLTEAAKSASAEAGAHLATLKAEIAATVDTATPQGRAAIRTGVSTARGIVAQGATGVTLFTVWGGLEEAGEAAPFQALPEAIAKALEQLGRALIWHARQTEDDKFRLKALAAQFYLPPHQHTDPAHCPVCEGVLQTTTQQALAKELAELRADAAEAERRLEDVCRELESELEKRLPAGVKRHSDALATMNPKESYADAIRARFCTSPPFSTVLTGLAAAVKAKVTAQVAAMPEFAYPVFAYEGQEPDAAITLRKTIHGLERLIALTTWWMSNRQLFRDAWLDMQGQKQEDGNFPTGSIEAHLVVLESALHKADPLDDLSKLLLAAATAATAWAPIAAEQARRQAIVEALKPLKDLRLLVTAETTRSIAGLSDRMKAILVRIHHQERLTYEKTSIDRKTVTVDGSFEPGMQIDAAFVANSSWLRAILWAFVLALREQTIEALGRNPFPLMVLDDPQGTFDPRNKRNWAKELARLANLDRGLGEGVQLLLTTHERQFYQMMIDAERLSGEQGMMGGVNKASGVAKIVNGGALERVYQEAAANNDDGRARDYISDIRIYTEDLLKFMLRSQGQTIPSMSLGDLVVELKNLSTARTIPFNRKPFADLVNTIMGGGGKPMKYINALHHKDDETYGVAQATEVKAFWEQTLRGQIHDAFEVFDTYESFYGEPRTFPWARNVVPFPNGFRDEVKSAALHQTGVAAAAKTDGIAGDGMFTVEEWEKGQPVNLFNHEIYQLAAGTLDPVAGIGDVVVVCNHAPVHRRNLVVAAVGETLLARRYNEMEAHPGIAILTGQSVDPTALAEPVIIAHERKTCRKIVGTLFASHMLPAPVGNPRHEVVALANAGALTKMLDGAKLFGVKGRSAEPIALDGQFLITHKAVADHASVKALDGRLIVAVDDAGTRYFKRLRCNGALMVLESLNPDGTTAAEVLSLDGALGLPVLAKALEVVGVLFELPAPKDAA